ncbi:hypothetical protein [Stutzerimonas nitrititolerans]|uniref:hypothetical protein n=1 Tax=Stutzerimonas nitrititolerans TaxID=2482751 RepID=UPI002693C468|nr:hypothetical protein [Stutzerimonas nitrititolerans]
MPGYLLTLQELGDRLRLEAIYFTQWHFSALFPTHADALDHFQEKPPLLDEAGLEHLKPLLHEH